MRDTLNNKIRIDHPLADKISIQDSAWHYCTPGESSEIAFFKNGEWVITPIAPFAKYHDGSTYDTAVYSHVPNQLIDSFLQEFGLDKSAPIN
jgi:hypothetical protein